VDNILLIRQRLGKLDLMIIKQLLVWHYDKRNSQTQRVKNRARACRSPSAVFVVMSSSVSVTSMTDNHTLDASTLGSTLGQSHIP